MFNFLALLQRTKHIKNQSSTYSESYYGETFNRSYFKVFNDISDHIDWQKHIEFASTVENIPMDFRSSWVRALNFLFREFGRDFLKRSPRDHPIIRMVSDKAIWRIEELISFVNTLNYVKTSSNSYSKLLGKLRSPKYAHIEGLPFEYIARQYIKAGFQVHFPNEIMKSCTPDIEITSPETGEIFFIEVSRLNESEERARNRVSFEGLSNVLAFNGYCLPYSFTQKSYLDRAELDNVTKIIMELKGRAFRELDLVTYEDERFLLAISHPDKNAKLEKWCLDNGVRNGYNGLSENFNETQRIARYKVRKEARQIPSTGTGIIYIPVHYIYLWMIDLNDAVSELKKGMQSFPNVLGVFLYSEACNQVDSFTWSECGNFYFHGMVNEAVAKSGLFVLNPCYNRTLTDDTIQRVYKTFLPNNYDMQ